MPHLETQRSQAPTQVPTASSSARSNCPDCQAGLALLRIINGRGGCEYWTMRCTRCGGIHLDIVKASPTPVVA
jgi:uncharacterized Zn finger protein